MASAMKLRRVRVVPTDLQVLLAARAEGVDVEELDKTSFFSTGKGEILRLTPDEMAPLTKESWERVESRNTGGVGGVVGRPSVGRRSAVVGVIALTYLHLHLLT